MTEPGDLESLHRHVQPVQAAISAAGGSVNKVLAERSGLTVLAAWGLLQHAHEDNSVRALRASLVSRERLLACGADASIGVATGRIFAGAVGTDDHKEYAVLGDVVNIAARLAHDGPPGIRCDGATRVEARSRILFESATTTKLRGRSDPVAVYTPLAEKPIRRDANVLLGREREREQLRRACDMLEAGHGGVVAIEGEAGIGKSRLVTDLIEWTQQRPVQSLIGWGESVERATPYHAWRQVFTRLLRLDTVGDRNAQRAAVLAALATPERQARVALANVVLPLDFPETAESESLKPAARARAARDLLVYLFEHFTHGRPTVLVFEDAQWMDSASWALLHDLSQTDAAVLAVMASRPVLADQMSPDWRSLRDAESTLRIRLEALTPSDALALACLRLDVDVLPAEVAGRVIQVAEGHPFFTEQLVLAMRDTDRVISVDQGECRIVSPLSTLTFAGTVHALVDSRIDSLTVQQQDTLKVAAVLGRRFDLWSLRAMHPGNPEAGELRKQLDTLVDLELLRVDDGVVGRTYRFKHAITQEAVSGWLLPSERRNLNARVARLLEEQHPADLTPVHARLAHHWREAGVVSKANDYLELAAQRALREDANQEALEFLEQALRGAQNGDAGQPGNAVRQAVWKRQSAEASWVMGDTLRARQYVEEAKRELRHAPRPAGRELATQLLIRAGRMFVPRRFVVTTDVAERQRLLEASRIAGLSALLNIDPVDQLAASADALLSYNLAERAGSTNVHALGMIGYAAGAIGLRGLARSHFARMHEEAQKHNDLRPLMFVLLLESMSVFSEGRIADAERSLREGLEWAGPAGNQRDRARLLLLLGAITCFSGKMRDGSLLVREAYGLAKYEDEASVERSWSLICLAGANAQHLPAADSLEAFHDLREKVRESVARDTVAHSGSDNHLRMATSQALEALIYVRAGRVDDAMRSAEGALRFFGSTRNLFGTHPTAWILVQGLFEALWAAWDAASHSDAKSAAHVETHARRYSRMLGRFAWMNPVYRPRALLFRGQVEWRRGRRRKAVELWQRSLDRAETLAAVQGEGGDRTFMFDRALAHLVLSRATATGQVDPRRLARSIDLFKQCEMPYFEHEADAALPLASARARP